MDSTTNTAMAESPKIPQEPLSRKKSQSKGINFNTVSPNLHRPKRHVSQTNTAYRARSNTKRDSEHKRGNPNRLNYEFTLPNAEQLSNLNIDEQLRLLALKEMAVVEIKDGISNLEQKLHTTELDLAQLRRLIQRSLYREISVAGTLHTSKAGVPVSRTEAPSTGPETSQPSDQTWQSPYEDDRASKLWTNLAKPISFIQLLDSLIQNEIEKSLAADDTPPVHPVRKQKHSPRTKPSLNRTKTLTPHPLKDTTNTHSQDWSLTKLAYQDSSEDMFQAVSTSLWTFVNDMKTNMLSSLNETPGTPPLCPRDDGKREKAAVSINDSDLIDLSQEIEEEEEEKETEKTKDDEDLVDLSIYSSMRRKKSSA